MIPNMRNTMRGWTKPYEVLIITFGIDSDRGTRTQIANPMTLQINKQPTPANKVQRRPSEQWSWKWWSLIVIDGPRLQNDDAIVIDGMRYRIEEVSDWSESGFMKYQTVEDYVYEIPEPDPDPEPEE